MHFVRPMVFVVLKIRGKMFLLQDYGRGRFRFYKTVVLRVTDKNIFNNHIQNLHDAQAARASRLAGFSMFPNYYYCFLFPRVCFSLWSLNFSRLNTFFLVGKADSVGTATRVSGHVVLRVIFATRPRLTLAGTATYAQP